MEEEFYVSLACGKVDERESFRFDIGVRRGFVMTSYFSCVHGKK